jgi:hydrogenase assembly chaperone HypC/HupF
VCLALPGRIQRTRGVEADVLVGETLRTVGLQLHPQARAGDYVLVKTGLVVEVLSEVEARELIAFFEEMVAALEERDGGA